MVWELVLWGLQELVDLVLELRSLLPQRFVLSLEVPDELIGATTLWMEGIHFELVLFDLFPQQV